MINGIQKRITLDFGEDENVSPQDLVRMEQGIHDIILSGVFRIRNGKAIVNMDENGCIGSIELQFFAYKRGKK